MARTAIDLFSGCGGLSEGLRQAGFDVLACAEIRPEARSTYKENHPDPIIENDIRLIDPSKLLIELGINKGALDLLAACPPCQGFSSMRTKNREVADDPRNDLIFEVERLVIGILPKCVLIENVPRLLKDRRLLEFKNALKAFGYQFSEGVLDAQNFGVAQRRKRMILIASRVGLISLPKPNGRKVIVKDVLNDLPSPEGDHRRPLHRIRQKLSPLVLRRLSKIKKSRSDLPEELILECHKRYPGGFRDVYGRIDWEDVAPTITRSSHNPSKGRFVHPFEDRGLTIYESMLLQGFPRSYIFPPNLGIGKLSSMIGEALPPPLARAQAIHIRKFLEKSEGH